MLPTLAGLLGVLTLGLLSPGPDFLLILRNSLGPTAARGFGTVAGITLGLAVQTSAIVLGFSALSPVALRTLQFAGAAYLAWLGLRALLSPPVSGTPETAAPTGHDSASSARSGFVDGLVCNLTNPKSLLFFVGIFAQVMPPDASLPWRIALPATIVLHGAVLWSLVMFALRSPPIAVRLQRAQHWLPRAFGLALVALALWLVATTLRP